MKVDLSFVTDSLLSQIDTQKIVTLILIIITSCVGFVLIWWGSRLLTKSILKAFKGEQLEFGTIEYKRFKKKKDPYGISEYNNPYDWADDHEYGSYQESSWGW